MRKYMYIFKSEFMSSIQYMSNNLINFAGYFLIMFIFLNLWQYIYSNPRELINGYSMNQMIWYVALTEVLWYGVGGRRLAKKIINDVRGGNVAYNINKPYNYIGYALFSHMGEILLRTIIYAAIAAILFVTVLGEFPVVGILQGLAVLLTCFFALVINTLFLTSIGLMAFFIEDSSPLYWLYSKVILVLGTLFPVEFFPEIIQKLFKFVPAYAVSYGPAKLFVDFSMDKFVEVIAAQAIYIIVALLIAKLIYKKGVKKLNVNGG